MTIKQHDLYVRTWHLAPSLLAEVFRAGDEELPPSAWLHWMMRVHEALRSVEARLWESGSYRPDCNWPDLDPLERVVLSLICRLSYYEKEGAAPGQFHGVALSVRMVAAYLKLYHKRGLSQAADILDALTDKGYLVVLEEARGRRPRVFLPNPLRVESPTLPLRTVRCATAPTVPEPNQTVRNGQEVRDTVQSQETVPPPPAQEGQGGASAAKAPPPASVRAFLATLGQRVGVLPKEDKAPAIDAQAFEATKQIAQNDPAVQEVQQHLMAARRAQGLA